MTNVYNVMQAIKMFVNIALRFGECACFEVQCSEGCVQVIRERASRTNPTNESVYIRTLGGGVYSMNDTHSGWVELEVSCNSTLCIYSNGSELFVPIEVIESIRVKHATEFGDEVNNFEMD